MKIKLKKQIFCCNSLTFDISANKPITLIACVSHSFMPIFLLESYFLSASHPEEERKWSWTTSLAIAEQIKIHFTIDQQKKTIGNNFGHLLNNLKGMPVRIPDIEMELKITDINASGSHGQYLSKVLHTHQLQKRKA